MGKPSKPRPAARATGAAKGADNRKDGYFPSASPQSAKDSADDINKTGSNDTVAVSGAVATKTGAGAALDATSTETTTGNATQTKPSAGNAFRATSAETTTGSAPQTGHDASNGADDSASSPGTGNAKGARRICRERSVYFKVGASTFAVGALLLLFDRLLDSLGDLTAWMQTAWNAMLGTLTPFLVAILLAYLFRLPVNKLSDWIARIPVRHKSGEVTTLERFVRSRRLVATGTIFAIIFIILAVAVVRVLPASAHNAVDLVQNMPRYVNTLIEWIDANLVNNQNIPAEWRSAIDSGVKSANAQFSTWLKGILSMVPQLLRQIIQIGSFTVQMLLAFVLAFYLLCDEGRMFRTFNEWAGAKMGKYRSRRVFRFMLDLDSMFSRYIVSRLMESLVVGVLCFIVLSAFNVSYGMLLSVFYAFMNLIPYVGPVIGLVPVVIVAILTTDTSGTIWVAILLTVVQGFDAWILSPKLLGDSMGLNPFWIILALVIGSALFGVVGLLLSTPIMAVVMNMINRSIAERRQRGEEVLDPLQQ